jgi:hypothetical protein
MAWINHIINIWPKKLNCPITGKNDTFIKAEIIFIVAFKQGHWIIDFLILYDYINF